MRRLIDQIKFEEGLRLEAYTCPAGKLTIGYGHNLDASPSLEGQKIPHRIDAAFAEVLLEIDIDKTIALLSEKWHGFQLLPPARRDACINMAFQLGVTGFMKFKKMRDAMLKCDWQKAADEALNSNWAKQTPERAQRVAGQIRTGEYYPIQKRRFACLD